MTASSCFLRRHSCAPTSCTASACPSQMRGKSRAFGALHFSQLTKRTNTVPTCTHARAHDPSSFLRLSRAKRDTIKNNPNFPCSSVVFFFNYIFELNSHLTIISCFCNVCTIRTSTAVRQIEILIITSSSNDTVVFVIRYIRHSLFSFARVFAGKAH